MGLSRGISTEIRIALATGAIAAALISTFWLSNRDFVRGTLVSQRRDQVSRLFNEQVRFLNQLSRERAQLAGSAARAGETMARLRTMGQLSWVDAEWDSFLAEDLKAELQRFPEAIRLGIWFEPFRFSGQERYRGYSATLAPEGVRVLVENGTSTPAEPRARGNTSRSAGAQLSKEGTVAPPPVVSDYHTEPWYSGTLTARASDVHAEGPDEVWFGPYNDGPGFLMTVGKVMYDDSGKVLGVATADWDLHRLVADIDNFKPTGTAQAFLIDSKTSTFAAVASRQDLAQRDVGTVAWGSFALHLPDSDVGSELHLATGNRWMHKTTLDNGLVFGLVVPEIEALGPVVAIEQTLLSGAVLAFALIVVSIVPIAGFFLRPVRHAAYQLRRFARGDFTEDPPLSAAPDLRALNEALSEAIGYVNRIESAVAALAKGDAEAALSSAGGGFDSLSRSVCELGAVCRSVTEDVRIKLLRVSAGDPQDPRWQRSYPGMWGDLVQEAKSCNERFANPLREACAVLDRLTEGDFAVRLSGTFQGDFAALQYSLNRALDHLQRLPQVEVTRRP